MGQSLLGIVLSKLIDEHHPSFQEYQSVQHSGPTLLAQYFDKNAKLQGMNKDCRILDCAAGTGLVGLEVQLS